MVDTLNDTLSEGQLRVENGGLLFTDNNAGVSGTDGGYSIPMGDKTLWMFGDVFLLDQQAGRYTGAISNCGLLVPRSRGTEVLRRHRFLTDSKTGIARQLITLEPGEGTNVRMWPGGGWFDPSTKRVYLFYQKVHTIGSGAFDFKVDGSGLARADASDPDNLKFDRLTVGGKDVWWDTPQEPLFGCAVVSGSPSPDPNLYIIGSFIDGRAKHARLARVRRGKIEDRSAYEYFLGNPSSPNWSKRVADSSNLDGIEDCPNELTISYNRWARGYLAVHTVGGMSERLRISKAPQPWGPYRTLCEIGAPKQAMARGFCYAGKEHPELAEDNGRIIYVTYVDSSRYWLQLLKVTLGP